MFEKFDKRHVIVSIHGNSNGDLINVSGHVFNCKHDPIDTGIDIDGYTTVEVEFMGEFGTHRVVDLMACHFKGLRHDEYLLREVVGFHVNKIRSDNRAVNVGYYFKTTPLESKEYPGYYYMPDYPEAVINKVGDVIYCRTGNVLNLNIVAHRKRNPKNIKGGYHSTIYSPPGMGRISLARHRAMMLAFKPIPNDVTKLIVNHIDGVPGNDTLDNLEWTTRGGNLDHAYRTGLRTQNRPVIIRYVLTGDTEEYHSVAECARHVGLNDRGLNQMLEQREFGTINSKGFQIKYVDDDREWIDVEDPEVAIRKAIQSIGVKARKCYTDEVIEFESISKAGESTGVNNGTIGYRFGKKDYSPLRGWQFIPEDAVGFPDFTKEEYESTLTEINQPVVARHVITNEVREYTSTARAEKAHNHFNVSTRLRTGDQPLIESGWQFKRLEDTWVDIENVEDTLYFLQTEVSAKHIETGSVIYASNIGEIANVLGIDARYINEACKSKGRIPYGGFLFRRGVTSEPFPEYNPNETKLFKIITPTGDEVYCDIEDAVELTGMAAPTIYKRVRQDRNHLPNDYVVYRNRSRYNN